MNTPDEHDRLIDEAIRTAPVASMPADFAAKVSALAATDTAPQRVDDALEIGLVVGLVIAGGAVAAGPFLQSLKLIASSTMTPPSWLLVVSICLALSALIRTRKNGSIGR